MNIIATILLVIIGLVVILLIIALFTKKDYIIERDVIVKQAKSDVFRYVRLIKNQDSYSKWVMSDPNMKKNFSGIDGTPGFVYAWDSDQKDTGKGEQEIKQVVHDEQIATEIRFERPFKNVSQALIVVNDVGGNQTKVKWSFASSMKYPMNMMLLFIDFEKLLGKDMETSLERLKGILEK
ncbi:MAG TPA: SRPBCC family protein [Chryseolinea sp.]|nr:SRPBCC family protein [Chryseolinea sp.]